MIILPVSVERFALENICPPEPCALIRSIHARGRSLTSQAKRGGFGYQGAPRSNPALPGSGSIFTLKMPVWMESTQAKSGPFGTILEEIYILSCISNSYV